MLNFAMDRKIVEKHLAEPKEHVAMGHRAIIGQREIIFRLERDRQDAGEARRLLAKFEELQKLHIADHDRLLNELAEAKASDD
jgi:uncharacterized protein (DUF488 family)